MRDDTSPGSYESHLRKRVKELECVQADAKALARRVEQLTDEVGWLRNEIRKRDELLDRMAT